MRVGDIPGAIRTNGPELRVVAVDNGKEQSASICRSWRDRPASMFHLPEFPSGFRIVGKQPSPPNPDKLGAIAPGNHDRHAVGFAVMDGNLAVIDGARGLPCGLTGILAEGNDILHVPSIYVENDIAPYKGWRAGGPSPPFMVAFQISPGP